MQVGIIGIGTYIPKSRRTAKEISEMTNGNWSEEALIEKQGIISISIAGVEEGTQEMGAVAAQRAVENAGIDPKEIDVVIGIGEEWKEYPLTTSSLYIQDKIGATNAWGIDVANRCCTALSAIKIAKDMLNSDSDINTILIAGGYRNGDFIDYSDPDVSMMYNLGSGGGALVLKKNAEKNIVLSSKIVSEPSLSRSAGVEIGGTKNPITKENIDIAYKSLRVMEPEKMKEVLKEKSLNNWFYCAKEALKESGYSESDIDYLAILHMKRSAHKAILKHFSLEENQSTYLEDYGHIGQIDQILSLELAKEQGKLKKGDIVLCLAAGIGYVWAASVIRWG